MRINIENLPVRAKQLGEKEMRSVFGGMVAPTFNSTMFKVSLEPGCALCLNGLTTQRPEGGGEWSTVEVQR